MRVFAIVSLALISAVAFAEPVVPRVAKVRTSQKGLGLQRPGKGPLSPFDGLPGEILPPARQRSFASWQRAARRELVGPSGRRLPVAVVEIGQWTRSKPTILHIHQAAGTPDDVLLYRLSGGFRKVGKPVRIVSVTWEHAEEVLNHLYRTTGQKVTVMGSAGAGLAAQLARANGDKVGHFISFDIMGTPGNVPSLVLAGNAGTAPVPAIRKMHAADKQANVVIIDKADFSLRARTTSSPFLLTPPREKAALNGSADSARVATGMAGTIHRFLEGQPLETPYLKRLQTDPAERSRVFSGSFH